MSLLTKVIVAVLALLTCAMSLDAQIPQLINYQGRVVVGQTNFDGTGQFKFALVNGDGTETYWSNDDTSTAGSEPIAAVTLTVNKGLYSALLGDTALTNMTAIPNAVFNNSDVRLRVWFNDGANGSQQLAPDQRIAAVGYAVIAGNVPDGAITAAKLAAGAVTGASIADGAIGAQQLAAGAAAANLNASGQSGVGSGGVVLSTNPNATALLNAGYVRLTTIETAERYRSIRNTPPGRRSQHSAVWTGAEMIVFGGLNNSVYYDDGARYDPALDRWTPLSKINAPSPRFAHTAVWSANYGMIIWGGGNVNTTLADGGRYDPVLDAWTPIPVSPVISARNYHSAVLIGNTMIVWGGTSLPTGGAPLNTGGRLDVYSLQWTGTSTGANSPTARYVHRAITTGTEMIVWGGANGSVPLNNGARYNPSTDTWTAMATPALSPRYAHEMVWTGSKMIAWGGLGSTIGFNDGAVYNPTNNTWSSMASATGIAGRYYFSSVWTGTEMIVFGGKDAGNLQLGDGGRYDPVLNQWTALQAPDLNAPRWLHTAIWTGGEMIVWGGEYGGGQDTGRRFNPTTNTWVTMQTHRRDETAVWTGSELIFWGGQLSLGNNSGAFTDEGLLWNSVTNTWRLIPSDPVMPTRYGHKAVWSGIEMLVWGGSQPGGGRYNPAGAGTWTAIPSQPELDFRFSNSALWTGSEMLIWGGATSESFVPNLRPDGGRYDPATGNWTLFAGDATVPPRLNQTTVWTGSEMLIWGGYSYDASFVYTYYNSGGRYNPATDQWTVINTADAPIARYGHTAVWSGSEMIVWGGVRSDFPYYLADGGRYNPAGDAWTPIEAPAGIGARSGHMAVWTGAEMLLWGGGGFAGGVYNNSLSGGARYDPTGAGTWSPIAPNREMGGRYGATAIWTGSEMLMTSSQGTYSEPGNFAEVFAYTPPKTLYLYLRP